MFRLLGDVRRGTQQRRRNRRSDSLKFFADVTLVRPRGRCRRGNNKGDTAETATSLNYFAGMGLRCARMKTTAGYITEAALPKRHLIGLFRACLSSPPRVANSAEQITEVDQLTRALVRFLRHPWCLLGALVRFRNSENKGESSESAWPTNHVATTDLRAARMKKYNRANFTGHSHVTQLGSSVSSSWAFFRARLIPGLRAVFSRLSDRIPPRVEEPVLLSSVLFFCLSSSLSSESLAF